MLKAAALLWSYLLSPPESGSVESRQRAAGIAMVQPGSGSKRMSMWFRTGDGIGAVLQTTRIVSRPHERLTVDVTQWLSVGTATRTVSLDSSPSHFGE